MTNTTTRTARPFGLWPSPLAAKAMAGQLRLQDVQFLEDGTLVWCEGRGGKGVLVRWSRDEGMCDVTTEQSVRGGVGYGGGEFGVGGETLFFGGGDGRLYKIGARHGGSRALSPKFGSVAAPTVWGEDVVMVHTYEGRDVLAVLSSEGIEEGWPKALVSGADFYMQPAWRADGEMLAWVSWDQPNMPWDGTRLEVAKVGRSKEGGVYLEGEVEVWAGGVEEAVQQPMFSPDGGKLAYLSDRTGWMQIWVRDLGTGEERMISDGEGDYGGPAWIQGLRSMAWTPDGGGIYGICNRSGKRSLVKYSSDGGSKEEMVWSKEYDNIEQITVSKGGDVGVIVSAAQVPPRVVMWDAKSEKAYVVKRSGAERTPKGALSKVRGVSWKGEGGEEVHGNYYAPTSESFKGQQGELPPAIVMIHGGPTAQAMASWSTRNQFYATRGYAVLDVNYRGSTGYGREYMKALRGNWGVLDVEDAVSAVEYLAKEGLADPKRVVIMGGSAGGYTVLHALVKRPGVFAAGISMYGISNLFSLVEGTHKFEAKYNDMLLGELPQHNEVWRERSPIFFTERFADPVAIYQGKEDKVVPPEQAEQIVASLRRGGVPHIYELYEGEGHGWRKPETIERFYESTLKFLSQHVLVTGNK